MAPPEWVSVAGPVAAGGDSLVAHRGVVGPGSDIVAGDSRPACAEHNAAGSSRPSRSRDRRGHRPGGSCGRDEWGCGAASRARLDPRHAGLVPVQGRRGPRALRRQGQEPAEPALELLRAAGVAPAAHPPDGGRRRRPSSGSRSATRSRRSSSSTTSSRRHRPRFNIRYKDDKSYPYLAVTLDEEWPRAMVMRGAKRKGVRYFGPYAHAYAIRETLDLLLRTFPIRTCTNAQVRPSPAGSVARASTRTSRSAPRRASARSRPRSTTALVDELLAFLDGEHRSGGRPPRTADARGGRGARVRAGGAAARPADVGPQGDRASADGCGQGGGLRRHRAREDELEASVQVFFVRRGRVVGRRGLVVDKVEDVDSPAARRLASSSSSTRGARRGRAPRGARAGRRPRIRRWPRRSCRRCAGRTSGCASRGAGPKRELLSDGHTQRRPRRSRSTSSRRASDHNARARALTALQEALGLARGTVAHRVLRHLEPPGHRDRRLDGRDGGRARQARRLPALQDPAPGGTGRLRRHGGGPDAALPALPRRARRGRTRREAVLVPAEPAARRRRARAS